MSTSKQSFPFEWRLSSHTNYSTSLKSISLEKSVACDQTRATDMIVIKIIMLISNNLMLCHIRTVQCFLLLFFLLLLFQSSSLQPDSRTVSNLFSQLVFCHRTSAHVRRVNIFNAFFFFFSFPHSIQCNRI